MIRKHSDYRLWSISYLIADGYKEWLTTWDKYRICMKGTSAVQEEIDSLTIRCCIKGL